MNSGRVMNLRVTIPAESRRMNVGKDVIRILGSPAYICILQRKDRQSIATVSYTHLRAHETDSYLVCRLLLEKKNTDKKKKTIHNST